MCHGINLPRQAVNKKGTKDNPLRILVADNWGAEANSYLKSAFPNVKFSVYYKAPSRHPHGHMVAECICHMLPSWVHAEIVFHPYITVQNQPELDWMEVIKSEREAGRPFDICNCSFGQHHGDQDRLRFWLGQKWNQPEVLKEAKEKIGDTIVFFAAGNQDSSRRGRPDEDNDINYPQRALDALGNLFVIGACDYQGIPTTFSSDGEEVFAMHLGQDVVVDDPIKNRITRVDGTSFACPFFTGFAAELIAHGEVLSEEFLTKYVIDNCFIAEGWERGKRHAKAGYGSMLFTLFSKPYYQNNYINEHCVLSFERSYMDFDDVSDLQV